jgi:hypothetical protein
MERSPGFVHGQSPPTVFLRVDQRDRSVALFERRSARPKIATCLLEADDRERVSRVHGRSIASGQQALSTDQRIVNVSRTRLLRDGRAGETDPPRAGGEQQRSPQVLGRPAFHGSTK